MNVVELTMLMALEDQAMLAGWKLSLQRGFLMQAPFCVLGFLLGAWAWSQTRATGNAIAALATLANVPWTLAVIAPVNNALQATAPDPAGGEARSLIERWASLRMVRTGLGALAVVSFLWALSI